MFLSSKEKYTSKHNHGIFQDQALIHLAYFLNTKDSKKWLELAKNRLEAQKNYAFTGEMVHVENSPGYQIGVIATFGQIADFLRRQHDAYGDELQKDLERSLDFMAWAVKPNGILAEIGDTLSSMNTLKTDFTSQRFGNDYYSYAATLGQVGVMPKRKSIIFPKSGYYFGRSTWKAEDYPQATWTMFKAGYLSKTHKHADDLSFMLYSKGYDILVDPGYYNYAYGNKFHEYFISSGAHNTVTVDGKSYSTTAENKDKTGIFSYLLGDEVDRIIAFNDMYNGVQIDRHFLYGGDVVLIIDDMTSDKEHEYSEHLHLSEHMKIESISNHEVVCLIGNSGYKLRIRQLNEKADLEVVNGADKNARYGFLSRQLNKVQNINTIIWRAKAINLTLGILLTIEDSEGNVVVGKNGAISNISSFRINQKAHTADFKTKSGEIVDFSWTIREKPSFADVTTVIEQDSVTLENNIKSPGKWKYAWYLVDESKGRVVEKIPYSDDNRHTFKIEKDGTYLVRAFLLAKGGVQRATRLVAAVRRDKSGLTNVTSQYPYLNLNYKGHTMEKKGKNTWKFSLDYDYSLRSSIKWFIYRNGGYYRSWTTPGVNELEYTFTEPGTYAVLYYLRTNNGDNEFHSFDELLVE